MKARFSGSKYRWIWFLSKSSESRLTSLPKLVLSPWPHPFRYNSASHVYKKLLSYDTKVMWQSYITTKYRTGKRYWSKYLPIAPGIMDLHSSSATRKVCYRPISRSRHRAVWKISSSRDILRPWDPRAHLFPRARCRLLGEVNNFFVLRHANLTIPYMYYRIYLCTKSLCSDTKYTSCTRSPGAQCNQHSVTRPLKMIWDVIRLLSPSYSTVFVTRQLVIVCTRHYEHKEILHPVGDGVW